MSLEQNPQVIIRRSCPKSHYRMFPSRQQSNCSICTPIQCWLNVRWRRRDRRDGGITAVCLCLLSCRFHMNNRSQMKTRDCLTCGEHTIRSRKYPWELGWFSLASFSFSGPWLLFHDSIFCITRFQLCKGHLVHQATLGSLSHGLVTHNTIRKINSLQSNLIKMDLLQ